MLDKKEITLEEKSYLVTQLNNLMGKKPHFYLKFTKSAKYANDVLDGRLYTNTANYFRDLELSSGIRGQGDQFELLNIINAIKFTIKDPDSDEILISGDGGTLSIRYKDDDNIPIYSLVGIPLSEMKLINYDDNHAEFIFPFSEDEYKQMEENFGSFCVLIDGNELENKIKNYSKVNNCEYVFDKVIYCKQNTLERIKCFNSAAKERFLYKNEDLKYQHEYRIAFAHTIPENHFINIGKLQNAVIINSKTLQNIIFTINYDSHQETNT